MTDLFLGEHVPDELTDFATAVGPQPDDVLAEMAAVAREEGFPIVGPAVGGWLSQLARIHGARRVFEFGSGFGYSAYWFARALPDDGDIVLTDFEAENLERAEEYLERGGYRDLAAFEAGDALETARQYDGPFDVVYLDVEKYQYRAAFEMMAEAVPPGGMVVADNTMTAGRETVDDTVDFDALRAVVTDPDVDLADLDVPESAREGTQGVLDFFAAVDDHPDFETTVLPLGDGVTVSTRVRG